MKYCERCKLSVDTLNNTCPLCYGELTGESEREHEVFMPRKEDEKVNKRTSMAVKIFAFLSICTSIICVFINFVTKDPVMWSLIVLLGILYLWVFVAHTILSRRSFFEKVFFQICMILSIMFACELIAPSERSWVINYVLPSVCILTIVVLNFFSLIGGKKYRFLLSCLIIYMLFFVIGIIMWALNLTEFKILYYISIIYSVISICGTFLFGYRIIASEFKKKMHF